ncbi:SdpI family protein [Mangrovibacillus sp. Mu-81]|uniref:SdpI family protein n=1 Tax=Mangrovibacillus sp. Mu-81 TaxID=3121478 RepID=UPI002FE48C79
MENLGPALTNIAFAMLFIGLNIPLLMGKIKMNHFYGMRIGKSFYSDELWYKINKFGAKRFIIWSIPLLIVGVISIFLDPFSEPLSIFLTFMPCLIIIIPTIQVLLYSTKL